VVALAAYRGERAELRMEFLDLACNNYFGLQSPALNKLSSRDSVAGHAPQPTLPTAKTPPPTVNRPQTQSPTQIPTQTRPQNLPTNVITSPIGFNTINSVINNP
jgi:hypothetical protein